MIGEKMLVDCFVVAIQPDVCAVYVNMGEIALRTIHVVSQDVVRERLADVGWIGESIAQFDIGVVLVFLIYDVIQFDMKGIFRIVGIVRAVAFVFNTHLYEGCSIDTHRIGDSILFCGLSLLVEHSIPIALSEKDFDGLDGGLVVETTYLSTE